MILAISIISFYFYNDKLSQETVAQFGDYVGGIVNPILSFATISLLVWSIQIQLRELKLTRNEMEENTKANENQAKSLRMQLELLKTKDRLDNVKKELVTIEERLEVMLNFEINENNDKDPKYTYTLKEILWGTNLFANYSLENILKNENSECFKKSPIYQFRTELISYSNETMYCITRLIELKEYNFSMIKLIQFINFYQRVIALQLLPKLQANKIAQYTSGLTSALPDLEEPYLNDLKTLAIEESIKIFNITQE